MNKLKKYFTSKNFLLDSIFIIAILAFSLFHIFFYQNANYLNTFYPDWLVHAFRIKFLQQFGMLSWTHIWGNGINIWRAYQFIPHVLTLLLINAFHLSVTKGMIIMTIILFILLRFLIYIPIRALGFSPMVGLISVILSYDIAQYWSGVADFSLLFGFTIFPIILALWIAYTKGRVTNTFPFIIGLLFYIHPLLGISSAVLWVIGIFASKRAVFSIDNAQQLLILIIASSLFWLPIIYKPSFVYTSSNIASKYFLKLVLSSFEYWGLSMSLVAAMILSAVQLFLPIKEEFKWVKSLTVFTLGYFILVLIGITVDLPKIIAQFQFTRGVTFIGLATIFVSAPIIQWLINRKNTLINLGIAFILMLITVEGLWLSSAFSPQTISKYEEPVSKYVQLHPTTDVKSSRIWASDIGTFSYFAPIDTKLPYSYMTHLDTNQISPRIFQLIDYQAYVGDIPQENVNRIDDYFKVAGVKYAFFDESSPFTKNFSQSTNPKYKNIGRVTFTKSLYHLFEMPWEIKSAALIMPEYINTLQSFPHNLVLENPNDQIQLDNYVKTFANTIYNSKNTSLSVEYPTQDSLKVNIPANKSTKFVYIAESYDSEWHAMFNDKDASIESVGPNYMLITLPNTTEKGTLYLKHTWPITYFGSWVLIVIIPLLIFVAHIVTIFKKRKNGKKEK